MFTSGKHIARAHKPSGDLGFFLELSSNGCWNYTLCICFSLVWLTPCCCFSFCCVDSPTFWAVPVYFPILHLKFPSIATVIIKKTRPFKLISGGHISSLRVYNFFLWVLQFSTKLFQRHGHQNRTLYMSHSLTKTAHGRGIPPLFPHTNPRSGLEGVVAQGRRIGTRWSLGSLPIETILWFIVIHHCLEKH